MAVPAEKKEAAPHARLRRACGLPAALPEKKPANSHFFLGKGVVPENQKNLWGYFPFLRKRGNRPTQADTGILPDSPERGLQGRQTGADVASVLTSALASDATREVGVYLRPGASERAGSMLSGLFSVLWTVVCGDGYVGTKAELWWRKHVVQFICLSNVFPLNASKHYAPAGRYVPLLQPLCEAIWQNLVKPKICKYRIPAFRF